MTDNRKAGIALIAGSLGSMVTMGLHPRGNGSLTAEQLAHLSSQSAAVHSLAIISFVLMFLGACGLVQRIAAADRIAFSALVTYGFACVAIMIAAAVSGFIVPDIMRHMVRDAPASAPQWRMIVISIFEINQAFARIYSVGASAAIILWSVCALRNGGLSRAVAIYGCIIGSLITVGIGIGHITLDVHGMTVVALGQAIWTVIVGAQLCARGPEITSSSVPR